MNMIENGVNRFGYSSRKNGPIFLYCIIMAILTIAIIFASCGAIPGGEESDAVVNNFMTAAAAKDIDCACACFGDLVDEELKKDVEELILNDYQLFEGYEDVKMRSISVSTGKVYPEAEYGGEVVYSGNFKGWVDATLVKRGDVWILTWINVEISQEKLEDYIRRHEGT